mmetsp:Transcript_91789/g.259888  ORF Transcript_91789/g.259888 Transcript_91789/m.259888 type:complete len:170 (-) Transcript_91789:23-532(-)
MMYFIMGVWSLLLALHDLFMTKGITSFFQLAVIAWFFQFVVFTAPMFVLSESLKAARAKAVAGNVILKSSAFAPVHLYWMTTLAHARCQEQPQHLNTHFGWFVCVNAPLLFLIFVYWALWSTFHPKTVAKNCFWTVSHIGDVLSGAASLLVFSLWVPSASEKDGEKKDA